VAGFSLWVLVAAGATQPDQTHRLKSLCGNKKIFVGHGFNRAIKRLN